MNITTKETIEMPDVLNSHDHERSDHDRRDATDDLAQQQPSTTDDQVGVPELVATGVAMLAAIASGALLFSESAKGVRDFRDLLLQVGLPAIVVLAGVFIVAKRSCWRRLRVGIPLGAAAGAIATIGLEVVRQIGFRGFESMPGDLPRLMGIRATGRIMQGPSGWSDFLGYALHFWNGAAFGIVFVLIVGGLPASRMWRLLGVAAGAVYGLLLGVGFALGPVPKSLGIGGPFSTVTVFEFRLTVYLAHLVFGLILGVITVRHDSKMQPLWVGLQQLAARLWSRAR